MAFINWVKPLIGALSIESLSHATDSNNLINGRLVL